MAELTTRKIIAGVLVVISILGIVLLIYHFLTELILIFTGIVISISMAPVVDWLRNHKLHRSLSVILIYLLLVGIFFGFIFLVIPQMIQQVTDLGPRLENIYTGIKTTLQNSSFPTIRQLVSDLPSSLSSISLSNPQGTGDGAINTVNLTLNVAQKVLQDLFTICVILLVGFYWTLEGGRVEYSFSLLFPEEKRDDTRQIIQDIESRVGGFMRGQGLLALAIGGMAFVAYFIIGLPSLLPLAFLAGLCELIPVFGPALGALPALLIAVSTSPTKLIWVILATISMQFLENHLLAPRIMLKTVGVSPIVTILSISSFGILFGFPGLLMAIPLAAVIQVIVDRSIIQPVATKVEAPEGRDRLSMLRFEAQEFVMDIRKRVRIKETTAADDDSDEIEDAIESIATDLDCLLAETIQPEKLP